VEGVPTVPAGTSKCSFSIVGWVEARNPAQHANKLGFRKASTQPTVLGLLVPTRRAVGGISAHGTRAEGVPTMPVGMSIVANPVDSALISFP
jgi:hypothetical protein